MSLRLGKAIMQSGAVASGVHRAGPPADPIVALKRTVYAKSLPRVFDEVARFRVPREVDQDPLHVPAAANNRTACYHAYPQPRRVPNQQGERYEDRHESRGQGSRHPSSACESVAIGVGENTERPQLDPNARGLPQSASLARGTPRGPKEDRHGKEITRN